MSGDKRLTTVSRIRPVVVATAIAILLAACASSPSRDAGRQHVVRRGETLFTIAWRYGEDPREVARWNNLGDGSLIYPGQVISLTPPGGSNSRARAPAQPRAAAPKPLPKIPVEPPPAWQWPTTGAVEVRFGGRPGSGTGILIGGDAGQPIRAAASGRVVYSGGGLNGYGQLIIVKHNDTYLSAYGHNSTLIVKEGETVRQGQRIATMGEGPGRQPRLHFEIRKNGKPVDPQKLLPSK